MTRNITDKIIEKRTDSSLFFFEGTYKAFNPFFSLPKRVEVVLNEVIIGPGFPAKDTIYAYEIFAYDNDTRRANRKSKGV